jgi:hypothetical protein
MYTHPLGFRCLLCKTPISPLNLVSGDDFDAFMALELYDGSLRGISGKFNEDEVFKIENEELEDFEKQFSYKEKHVTDTQLKL